MVCFTMPAACISSSSCGPAACTTIGVRPTCCRKPSELTSASSSSRRIAPPTLTTAKRAASSCEKRLRYCWISLALAMLESRRTIVVRMSLIVSRGSLRGYRKQPPIAGEGVRGGRRHIRRQGIHGSALQQVAVGGCSSRELLQRDPFVGAMRLRDVAGAVDQRRQSRRGKQRGLG